METNIIIDMTVVIIPIFLDLVQPANDIIMDNARRPNRSDEVPIIRFNKKSAVVTFFKYPPGVVFIIIVVNAKTEIRKLAVAVTAAIKIAFKILLFLSETKRFATTVIEKPLNSEEIRTVCFASSFQYSKVICILKSPLR